MVRFLLLSGRALSKKAKTFDGFAGAIAMEGPDEDFAFDADHLPEDVGLIKTVESPVCLEFLSCQPAALRNRAVEICSQSRGGLLVPIARLAADNQAKHLILKVFWQLPVYIRNARPDSAHPTFLRAPESTDLARPAIRPGPAFVEWQGKLDEDEHAVFGWCSGVAALAVDRLYGMYRALGRVVSDRVEGAVALYGSWGGAAAAMAALALEQYGDRNRRILLVRSDKVKKGDWTQTPMEEALTLLRNTGHANYDTVFCDDKIALLHIGAGACFPAGAAVLSDKGLVLVDNAGGGSETLDYLATNKIPFITLATSCGGAENTESAKALGLAGPPCIICEADSRFARLNRRFRIFECGGCGHAFVNPLPTLEELSKLYSKWAYWEQDKLHQGICAPEPGTHWQNWLSSRIEIIARCSAVSPPPSSILEIGCSEGALLNHFYLLGHNVLGCEINAEIVERARRIFPFSIEAADFMAIGFAGNKFDTILSFHTFEHLIDPVAAVERCAELLKPGGKLLIEVPFGPDEYGNLDHLHFFSKQSVVCMLEKFFTDVVLVESAYLTAGKKLMGSYVACGTLAELDTKEATKA